MSLSAKFAKIQSAPSRVAQNKRKTSFVAAKKDNRNRKVSQKRGIAPPPKTKQHNAKKANTPQKGVKGKKVAVKVVKVQRQTVKSPKGKATPTKGKKAAAAAKAKVSKAAKAEKPAPKTAEELDDDMATYWFEAGKGPDPKLAKLDREMEAYRAEGSARTEAAAEDMVVA